MRGDILDAVELRVHFEHLATTLSWSDPPQTLPLRGTEETRLVQGDSGIFRENNSIWEGADSVDLWPPPFF